MVLNLIKKGNIMSECLVLHVSKTSLAGAPIRIVNALNKYTDYTARLINFMPSSLMDDTNVFEEDLNWQSSSDKPIIRDLIKKADIIHFHHFMDLEFYNPFLINFFKETKPSCKFLRHFHTDKQFIMRNDLDFNKFYPKDNLPRVVIPHYPERTFMDCTIVPNIIPINEAYCMPKTVENKKPIVAYSASMRTSYKKERWATKGYPEVTAKLRELSSKLDFELIEIVGKTFEKAMEIKQNADIVIGDVVTGSYHLTELEALSLGKPCLTYLDGRSVMTFINTFKSSDIPFVNVNIDNLEPALEALIRNKDLRINLGAFSRKWIEKYYNDELLIKHFVELYEKLLNDKPLTRENCFEYTDVKEFLYNEVYDYNWQRLSAE